MNEMVKRVARAIYGAHRKNFTALELATARAAILAMCEPTDEMVSYADDQFDWGPSGYFDAPQGACDPRRCWQVMIDAALK